MQQHFASLDVQTRADSFTEITNHVAQVVADSGVRDGLLTLFLRHTSASLLIMENADPDVLYDLRGALDRLAPENGPYRHTMEGPDDMPAHIKAALLPQSLSIPVRGGRPQLGTWQGVFVVEHRANAHIRHIECHIIGE